MRSEIVSVQHLRAMAAMAVLVFHGADRMGWRFGVGAAGVDVFFVISGFIMWVIAAQTAPSSSSFLMRRAERIAPLYWIATLSLAGVWLVAPSLLPRLQVTAGHLILSLLFIPHADPTGLVAPLLEPGWTLTYEVFFYLVFAAALNIPARGRLAVLTGVLALLAGLGALFRPDDPILKTYASPLLLEFLAGIWIGRAWSRGVALPRLVALGLFIGGLATLAGVQILDLEVDRWRILLWGLPAALIVSGALGVERAGLWPRSRVITLLGDASYSIYLIHGLAIAAALHLAPRLFGDAPFPVFAMILAAGVLGGLACYLAVERPLIRALHRPHRKPHSRAKVD